jgi:hypothetical protein
LLLQFTVPDAEIPVCRGVNGNDDDVLSQNLTFLDGAWVVGRGCASGLLPFRLVPPLLLFSTATKPSVSSLDDTAAERDVPLAGRSPGGSIFAAVSAAGGIASLYAVSRHHSSSLLRNRALRTPGGSRGPGPLGPIGPFPIAVSSLPVRSEQQRRRGAAASAGPTGEGVPWSLSLEPQGPFLLPPSLWWSVPLALSPSHPSRSVVLPSPVND